MDFEAYRDYVRRGFGELLVVAVLTLLLILGLRWLTWKETRREARIVNAQMPETMNSTRPVAVRLSVVVTVTVAVYRPFAR